jgi:hypothetical protein
MQTKPFIWAYIAWYWGVPPALIALSLWTIIYGY